MAQSKTAEKKSGLTMKHLIGYGAGDFGGCMTFALMGSIATRYYTNVLQVNTVILAAILLIWNVWDAVNDPLVGALMDKIYAKSHNPKGKFRPWLLRSAPLVCVTAIIFWTVPTFFEGTTMLVVLFFTKILYEGCYTFFNIPMGSLLSSMAENDKERSSLSSARGFGSLLGNMVPLVIFPQLLAMLGDTPEAFAIGSVVCAGIGLVLCLIHYAWTEERFITETPPEDADKVKMTDIFQVFRKNRAFLALCLHGFCICTMQYVASTLGTYMYSDVLGDIGMMSYATLISMPISVITLLVVPKLAEKMELVKVIRGALLIGAACYFSLFIVMMFISIPAVVYMIWAGLGSGIAGVSILMQWGLVGEAIDYNEMVTGKRTEGSIYGTFNLARRIGQSFGTSAAVLALGWIGYDATLAAQSAFTIAGIKALVVLIPGIFVLGSWVAFKYVWNINADIRAKMAEFKAAQKAD